MTMTFAKAYQIAIDLIDDGIARDAHLETPGRCVTALHVLEDEGDAEAIDLIHAVYDFTPGLLNFDAAGNWTGPVANENGWAA
jgi:hypothetical protein